MHSQAAQPPQPGSLRTLRRSIEREIRDQYLDEGKGAPLPHKLQLGLKIRCRIWYTFVKRVPRAILTSKR